MRCHGDRSKSDGAEQDCKRARESLGRLSGRRSVPADPSPGRVSQAEQQKMLNVSQVAKADEVVPSGDALAEQQHAEGDGN